MLIGIFGSSGYLGNQCVLLCKSMSLNYVCLDRKISNHDEFTLQQITHVIDCGFPRNYYSKNVSAEYLVEINRRKNIFSELGKKYIYIGTYTGITSADTCYSVTKRQAELTLQTFDATIFRAGLVVSQSQPGGRYQELLSLLERLPFAFIPSKEWFPLVISDLDETIKQIGSVLRSEKVNHSAAVKVVPLGALILEQFSHKIQIKIPAIFCRFFSWSIRMMPLQKLEGITAISIPVKFSRDVVKKMSDSS